MKGRANRVGTLLGIFGVAVCTAVATPASVAEQSCDRYAVSNQLPDRFEEIARGDFARIRIEIVVLTDGTCTCANAFEVDRALGKPAPANVNWSCHDTTPDERRSD